MTQVYEVSKNLQNLLSFCLACWHLAIATTSYVVQWLNILVISRMLTKRVFITIVQMNITTIRVGENKDYNG